MTTISVVVETWNAHGALPRSLMSALAPQLRAADAQLVVTHTGYSAAARATLEQRAGQKIDWVLMSQSDGYYRHKNAGFDATTGSIVAFIDNDCTPSASWLDALVKPIRNGTAEVAAGYTTYPGPVARIANPIDFPYFPSKHPGHVKNFFANNVAFARDVFAARRYPRIDAMFHGQCQVLALQLVRDDIGIQFAREARLVHAWPDTLRDWLHVRLNRGADTATLLPYVVDAYAPRLSSISKHLAPLATVAIFTTRGLLAAANALRNGPRLQGLGFAALSTTADTFGLLLRGRTQLFNRDV